MRNATFPAGRSVAHLVYVLILPIALALAAAPSRPEPRALTLARRDTTFCIAAADFLRREQRMIAAIEPDTVDDWRTARRHAGCRVTAAGATPLGVAREAPRVYERLRASGWTRTPDPRDAPNEASLRFRRDGVDCLFNVYEVPRLFTEAEFLVNEAVHLTAGESRYQVFVMCLPAMEAARRSPVGAGRGSPASPYMDRYDEHLPLGAHSLAVGKIPRQGSSRPLQHLPHGSIE